VRLTVTLGGQHSEPVSLKHAPDGVLDVARVLCHEIVYTCASFLAPNNAAT